MESWFDVSWTIIFTVVIPLLLISMMATFVKGLQYKLFNTTTLFVNLYIVLLLFVFILGLSSNDICMYFDLPSGAFYIIPFIAFMLRSISSSLADIAIQSK